MKKVFKFLMILVCIFNIIKIDNVKAANRSYMSYTLSLNKNYVSGTLSGSALLEGYESGIEVDGGVCTSAYECNLCSEDSRTYTYTLEGYALNKSGKVLKSEYLGGQSGTGVDSTYSFCDKDETGSCVENTTCYTGLGFDISFNLKGLMDEDVYGYELILTVTTASGHQEEFVINPSSGNANAKKVAGSAGGKPVIKQLDANVTCSNQLLKPAAKESLMCGTTNEVGINSGENCVNSTNSTYYSIACTEQIYISSSHSNNSNLKGGSGISNTVIVSQLKECGGKFDKNLWLEDYETLKTGYEAADTEKLKTYYRNKMDKLESYITDYTRAMNSLGATSSISASGSFKISYAAKSGNVSKTLNLKPEEHQGSGEFTEKTEVKLGITGVPNPYNFSYTNAANPSTVTLTLPMAYKNTKTNSYTYDDCSSCEAAGHKYYLAKDIDTTAEGDAAHKYITYQVEVKGMGESKAFDVVYEDCEIQLEGKVEYLYRAIDLKNPFITNLGHKIGLNWKNSYFDFTQVIKPVAGGSYSLVLSPEDTKKIKNSNNQNGANAYLGTCDGKTDDPACGIIGKGKK